jgi:membrane protease subunit (stomatin/prohibitin family)
MSHLSQQGRIEEFLRTSDGQALSRFLETVVQIRRQVLKSPIPQDVQTELLGFLDQLIIQIRMGRELSIAKQVALADELDEQLDLRLKELGIE